MNWKQLLLATAFLAVLAGAQTVHPALQATAPVPAKLTTAPVVPASAAATVAPSSTPTVPDQLRAELFKAQANAAAAQLALERTPEWGTLKQNENQLQTVVQKITAACGNAHTAQFIGGEPVCAPKPVKNALPPIKK